MKMLKSLKIIKVYQLKNMPYYTAGCFYPRYTKDRLLVWQDSGLTVPWTQNPLLAMNLGLEQAQRAKALFQGWGQLHGREVTFYCTDAALEHMLSAGCKAKISEAAPYKPAFPAYTFTGINRNAMSGLVQRLILHSDCIGLRTEKCPSFPNEFVPPV